MERTASHTTQVSPLSHVSSISVPRGPLESHTQKQNNNKKRKKQTKEHCPVWHYWLMSSICWYTEKKEKENVCGTIKHGLTEKLTQQETKTAPTSSQLQTPADLKHRQRHYCMLFCIGLLCWQASVCRATPKFHDFEKTRVFCCVMLKTFCFQLCSCPWNGGGVMGGDRGWSQEH